jgi:hypothetical protein
MINRYSFSLLMILALTVRLTGQSTVLKSPSDFLPHALGSRFTPHHLLVDYFQYVDGLSDKMQLVEYGQTYELRPLIAAIISSPANMKRIEEIRENNLHRTGLLEGDVTAENITIVYLSYTVHGNEAAGAESSMAVLYDLIKGGAQYDAWLENTIVIIDPTLNPDGYNRYSQWSNSVSSNPHNPSPGVREHSEPWPGGRSNHYYFDLNRDWAWQSQQESRDRVAFYLQWMPHVHADIHEMGAESPYYFAPAAPPYHSNVTDWQSKFQIDIGKNNATHFDKEGWLYYTRERFDLFYPSYGDTYPTFAGSIGMTYEQGGSGYANRAVMLESGDTLTLYDRIAHHRAASLSTIEVSSRHASDLVREFEAYFKKSVTDTPGAFNSYVIKASNHPGRVADLLLLLRRQGIVYGLAASDQKGIKGLSYVSGEQASFSLTQQDIIIPATQPRAVMTKVLFEPEAYLEDSLTYDITAWCLPMAYGLDMFATEVKLDYVPIKISVKEDVVIDGKPYGYALQWGSVSSAKALTDLMAHGIVASYASLPFKIDGKSFSAGTVLLLRGENRRHPDFDGIIRKIVDVSIVPITPLKTGFVEEGKDFGSNEYHLIRRPKVLALAGEGVRSLNLGEVWHFFEEELKQPIHIVNADEMDYASLGQYNVLVLTDGSYALSDKDLTKISEWVEAGGRLVAIGSAIRKLAGKNGFEIASPSMDEDDEKESKKEDIIHTPETYGSDERKSLSKDIPGTIFQTTMDKTHPLSFGLGEAYWTLKTTTTNYAWLKGNGNAIYLDSTPHYYGFAGYLALEETKNTLIAGQQDKGAGSIVYFVDNPLFRSFWNSGKVLFANALFF